MNQVETEILGTLRELERAVKPGVSGQGNPALQEIFSRLDNLARQLPQGANPNLLHYLQKQSYQKARLLLEGRDEENRRGSCAAP